jgi:hypothetical protein
MLTGDWGRTTQQILAARRYDYGASAGLSGVYSGDSIRRDLDP